VTGDVGLVLTGIEKEVEGKLVISTAAIIPIDYYEDLVPDARYVRSMPNIAALAKASFTAFTCGPGVTAEDKATVKTLLETMGTCTEVEEKYMDAITGLSGSGPHLSPVIDALVRGLRLGSHGSCLGLAQSVLGAAKLVLDGTLKPTGSPRWSPWATIGGIYGDRGRQAAHRPQTQLWPRPRRARTCDTSGKTE
jgi:pyrroline-5-carboxylate reductase